MNVLGLDAGPRASADREDLVAVESDREHRLLRGVIERLGGPALMALEASASVLHAVQLEDDRAALEHRLSSTAPDGLLIARTRHLRVFMETLEVQASSSALSALRAPDERSHRTRSP